MATSTLVTIGLGVRHTGLGRASLTQKLARARLRPAGFRPANEDHWLHPQGNGPAIVLNCGSFVATLKLDYHMLFATN